MIIFIVAFFCCGYSLASEASQLNREQVSNDAQLTIAEIKKKFRDRPALADFTLGIKLLGGAGLSSPAHAFQLFLQAAEQLPDARSALIQMCERNQCFPTLIEDKLEHLIAQAQQGNQDAFSLLVLFEATRQVRSALREKIKLALEPLYATYPALLLKATQELNPFNPPLAARYFHLLADTYNFAPAQEILGFYNIGSFNPAQKSPQHAIAYFEKAAAQGAPNSAHAAARMYLGGEGIPQDRQRAFKLLEQAADLGHPDATHSLGLQYFMGDLTAQNIQKAMGLFRKSAELGSREAYTTLGRLVEKGYQDDGTRSEDPDYAQAFELFNTAFQQGSVNAAFNIAFLYDTGLAGIVDHRKAQELYKRVLADDTPALLPIKAHMYEDGIGVEQDLEKAQKYYEITIARGNEIYQKKLEAVRAKIAEARAAQEIDASIEVPRRAPRNQRRPSPEQVAYGQRRSAEALLKGSINLEYPVTDGSAVTEVDLERNTITVMRPSDGTVVIIPIEPQNKRKLKRVKQFTYAPRVQQWFDMLGSQGAALPLQEYNSMIRHAIPEKADLVAQLFGYKTSEAKETEKSKSTLAISGTLIPGRTKESLSGTLVYGYDGSKLYHKFLHLNKDRVL